MSRFQVASFLFACSGNFPFNSFTAGFCAGDIKTTGEILGEINKQLVVFKATEIFF